MENGYTRVFAALDGGDTQRMVMEKAMMVAAENHAALCLGHVVDKTVGEATAAELKKISDATRARLEEELADLLAQASENPDIPSVDLRVEVGGVTDTLLRVVIAGFEPDLVICCKRGLSALKYAFVGSVSTSLIRNAPCDVLVVGK